MPDIQIPIQPVENPILCPPYKEPDKHWLYDTRTGIPSRNPGRRPAGYWFKTERTGSAQMSLLAEEERDDLPLVNALRDDVRRWRESGWENASETTKKLLRHWWREDRARQLFFCQIEAVETIVYLREILALEKKPRRTPKLTLEDYRLLTEGKNPRPQEWVAKLAQEGIVLCYARNNRLEFNIPYEFYGNPQIYEPDFIVRLRNGVNVVLEIKGESRTDTDAKHQAAQRWVAAVNRWEKLGEWDFLVCREPQRLAEELTKLVAVRNERVKVVAAELQTQAENEVRRLRSLGWTQSDFARALCELLETKGSE